MLWIDRLEKLGRLILWLVIASVLGIFPVAYAKQRRGEAELREALGRAEVQLTELSKPKKPVRLAYDSMGHGMLSLDQSAATGHLWFTNVSPRTGVVCVIGGAANRDTQKVVASMASCQDVAAYASRVHMVVQFAGGKLAEVCAKSACDLTFVDVPITDAEK